MTSDYYNHSRSEALDLLGSACPHRVLDIGCGRGGVSRELKRRCPSVTAIGLDLFVDTDFDYHTVFQEFHQVNLNTDALPVSLEGFDLILLLDVLEHLAQPEDVLASLVERADDNCQFLISVPNFHYYSNLFSIIRSARFLYRDDGILDRTHLRFFGYDDIYEILARHLRVESSATFNPFENAKSRLIGRLFGDRYRAYQNIFLCRNSKRAP